MTIVDLFAGPGGWSEGLRALGCSEIGIELDEAACKTARAAGHKRVREDVSALSPSDFAGAEGLIASPPCQAWSMAGKRGGERDKEHVIQCALELAAGTDTRWDHREACEDARSILVVEPLRWALALRPTWIAFEQVPPVLELWTLFAEILRREGYNVWAGVLEAERYGVPQTRERAILMAHRDRPVHPPVATHQRYVPGEPQRHDVTLEGEVLPWVSMAEALSWTGPQVPAPTVTAGGGAAGGVEVFARGGRERINVAIRDSRSPDFQRGDTPASEPAPTLGSTSRQAEWVPTHYDRRQGSTNPDTGVRTEARPIPVDEPAPTIAAQGLSKGRDVWVHEQEDLATWIGNPRLADPRLTTERRSGTTNPATGKPYRQFDGCIRVTEEEAAALQSFRPDYPWWGSRTARFTQIGNAVPPLLAEAVLRCLVDVPDELAEAA